MSNQEKLLVLLKAAKIHGWNEMPQFLLIHELFLGSIKIENCYFENNSLCYNKSNEVILRVSLNDLITDFRKDEDSFVKTLCAVTLCELSYNDYQYWLSQISTHIRTIFPYEEVVFLWNFKIIENRDIAHRPTSERLDWFLETFQHLINEKMIAKLILYFNIKMRI